jgi:hypothetical protein
LQLGKDLAMKTVWLSRVILLISSFALISLTGCEVDTRVKVSQENPPQFTFSGTGSIAQLYVGGPFTLDELKLVVGAEGKLLSEKEFSKIEQEVGGSRTLWRLDPRNVHKRLPDIPAITYGIIPEGFRQIYPEEGKPKPLLEGKYYSVSAPSRSANFHVLYFVIQDGKAVEIPRDRILKPSN